MKRFLGLLFVLLVCVVVATLALQPEWLKARWRAYKNRVVAELVERFQPMLPFKIVALDLGLSWQDMLHGELTDVTADLEWQGVEAHVTGTLRLVRARDSSAGGRKRFTVEFRPDIALRSPTLGRAPNLGLSAVLEIEPEHESIGMVTVQVDPVRTPTPWKWGPLDVKGADATIVLVGERLHLRSRFTKFEWSLGEGAFSPIAVEELQLDGDVSGLRSARVSKLRWSFAKGTAGLSDLPGIVGELEENTEIIRIEWRIESRVESRLGKSVVRAELRKGTPFLAGPLKTDGTIDLSALLKYPIIKDVLGSATFRKIPEIRSGKLRWQLEARTTQALIDDPVAAITAAAIKLTDLTVADRTKELLVRNVDLVAQIRGSDGDGSLSVEDLGIKKFQGTMKPSRFSLHLDRSSDATEITAKQLGAWNFALDGAALELKPWSLSASFPKRPKRSERDDQRPPPEPRFHLETGVILGTATAPIRAAWLEQGLCRQPGALPPIDVQAAFPLVMISKDNTDAADQISAQAFGKVDARLFSGKITVSNIEIFDLLNPVPEIDFEAAWSGIQLKSLTEWVGFGPMDGTVEGYAKGVVLQSWLPTQYDFKFEIKPSLETRIVFSPKAMRNTVKLFTGNEVENSMPGIAKWIAFGWFSDLLGGYNVNYAGLTLYSSRGSILLGTLDPEETVQRQRKRFFLKGPRFKIPLESSRYPVVLDAPRVANFTRHILRTLEALKEQKAGTNGTSSTEQLKEKSDEVESECLPNGF